MTEGAVYGPWRPVGEEVVIERDIPVVVGGLSGVPKITKTVPFYRRVERRPVWEFVGYEERTVES